jgi:hypothetical protein
MDNFRGQVLLKIDHRDFMNIWVVQKLPAIFYLLLKWCKAVCRLEYILVLISRNFSWGLEVKVIFILFLLHIIQLSFYLSIVMFFRVTSFQMAVRTYFTPSYVVSPQLVICLSDVVLCLCMYCCNSAWLFSSLVHIVAWITTSESAHWHL